jgi:FkbM family methyltransferase
MIPYTEQPPYYAQWGEDRWLVENLVPPLSGVFVDVGAGDGVRGSNSLYFENLGWHGLCVDADPRNHEPLRRRRCAIATCGVSVAAGPRKFGMCAYKPSWSGLDRSGPDYLKVSIMCETLNDLLAEHEIREIDLLSIDVEGTELDVWRSFESDRHQPSVVIIEFDNTHPDRHENTIRATLGLHTYELVWRTPANLILQRSDRPWRRTNGGR